MTVVDITIHQVQRYKYAATPRADAARAARAQALADKLAAPPVAD